MNIFFGDEQAEAFKDKYTILELDQVRFGNSGQVMTAYCIVETVPILEMVNLANLKDLHKNLMANYRKRDWNFCEQAIEHLMGAWNKELDSFYEDILTRIAGLKQQELDDTWDSVIQK